MPPTSRPRILLLHPNRGLLEWYAAAAKEDGLHAFTTTLGTYAMEHLRNCRREGRPVRLAFVDWGMGQYITDVSHIRKVRGAEPYLPEGAGPAEVFAFARDPPARVPPGIRKKLLKAAAEKPSERCVEGLDVVRMMLDEHPDLKVTIHTGASDHLRKDSKYRSLKRRYGRRVDLRDVEDEELLYNLGNYVRDRLGEGLKPAK